MNLCGGGADPSTAFLAILHVQYLSLHEDVFWRCVRCIGDSNAYTCTVGRNKKMAHQLFGPHDPT